MPGTVDIGNHGDDVFTTIPIPFSYTLYGNSYTSINLSSNGNAQFTTTDTTFTNVCLPWLTHNDTVFPYWDDLRTDVNAGCATYPGGVCGIFTSMTGSCAQSDLQHRMARGLFQQHRPAGQPRAEVVRGAESLRCDLRHGGSRQRQRNSWSAE